MVKIWKAKIVGGNFYVFSKSFQGANPILTFYMILLMQLCQKLINFINQEVLVKI